MSEHSFSSLHLSAEIVDNLASLGFASMTAIQAQSLPAILDGKDVIVEGQTGSGKTAAFGLGILAKLEIKLFKVQALVLCPTRELAEQVANEIRRLARSTPNIKVVTLTGGSALRVQVNSLKNGAHIVVGTLGRIEDHLKKGTLVVERLTSLVLDEADRMLDMGFQKTLDNIVGALPIDRQTMMFSATFPEAIESIANRIMKAPYKASVSVNHDSVRVTEYFYLVGSEPLRIVALQLLLLEHNFKTCVVFCNTRKDVQLVAGALKSSGFSAAALHGDMEQKDRDQALIRFANNSISILVATDVAARGLDIESLDKVINFQLPRELDVYTHRIGRTARAGKKGIASSLYVEQELLRIEQLSTHLNRAIKASDLPAQALLKKSPSRPEMSTLRIEGGKRQKLRAGDVVGALTRIDTANRVDIGGDQIGKIQILENWTYVAIKRNIAKAALKKFTSGKLKGKSFRARLI
jgi:ATP-independent RNA helicase DbpA